MGLWGGLWGSQNDFKLKEKVVPRIGYNFSFPGTTLKPISKIRKVHQPVLANRKLKEIASKFCPPVVKLTPSPCNISGTALDFQFGLSSIGWFTSFGSSGRT